MDIYIHSRRIGLKIDEIGGDVICGQYLIVSIHHGLVKIGMLDESVVNEKELLSIGPSGIFRFPDKAGLSGWVPLIESSTVIHTLSPRNFITIDIYCCKNFDLQKAKDVCLRFFAPKKIDEQYIERGMDYYKSDSNYHTVTVTSGAADSPEVILNKK